MGVSLKEAMEDPSKLDGLTAEEHANIMKELAAVEQGGEPTPKVEPKAEPEEVKTEAETKTEVVAEDGKKESPAGIIAPDGKSVIPYGVLQEERNARKNAEKALDELSGTVVELQGRLKALESGKSTDAPKQSEIDEINTEIDKLAEEAPEIAEMMRKVLSVSQAKVDELQQKLDKVEVAQSKTDEEVQDEINREIAMAIDNSPALTHWKNERPEIFAEAIAIDDALKQMPRWDGKPFAERFEQVVKLVVADHAGEDILPAAPKQETKVEPEKAKPTPAAVAKAAEAKLAKAEAAPGVTTLSDLPAGAAVEQSEAEKVENMSPVELAAKFATMSTDQISAYLQRVST